LKTKIVIPVEDDSGLNAKLAHHFGRAPFYALISLDENKQVTNVETIKNTGEHFGGEGHMHDHILKSKPNVIITPGMGPRGLSNFQSMHVAVLKANSDTLKDVISAYQSGSLQEITEGCLHSHHH
jgi:predicted Fe-Mo cluster-binding NifX family protein